MSKFFTRLAIAGALCTGLALAPRNAFADITAEGFDAKLKEDFDDNVPKSYYVEATTAATAHVTPGTARSVCYIAGTSGPGADLDGAGGNSGSYGVPLGYTVFSTFNTSTLVTVPESDYEIGVGLFEQSDPFDADHPWIFRGDAVWGFSTRTDPDNHDDDDEG